MTGYNRVLAVPAETTVPTPDQFEVVVDENLDEPEVRDRPDADGGPNLDEVTREALADLYSEYDEVRETGDVADRVDALERIVEQLTVLTTGETVEQLKN